MRPSLRKLVLVVHLTVSVGWIGAVAAYLAIAIFSTTRADAAAWMWTALDVIGWWAIVPLAASALVTGLILSLGTQWGLFRHYWVLISLALTVVCTVVLVEHMVEMNAMVAALSSGTVARGMGGEMRGGAEADLAHPGVGLAILLVIAVLNTYKPRGLTAYGWRKQQERLSKTRRLVASEPPASS